MLVIQEVFLSCHHSTGTVIIKTEPKNKENEMEFNLSVDMNHFLIFGPRWSKKSGY